MLCHDIIKLCISLAGEQGHPSWATSFGYPIRGLITLNYCGIFRSRVSFLDIGTPVGILNVQGGDDDQARSLEQAS